jgi:ABC-type sugar transport system permease subunit
MNKQDVKTALNTIRYTITYSFIELLKLLGVALIVISVIVGTGYCVLHYFWQSVVTVVIAGLSIWFWIELDNARENREYEEKERAIEEAWRELKEENP